MKIYYAKRPIALCDTLSISFKTAAQPSSPPEPAPLITNGTLYLAVVNCAKISVLTKRCARCSGVTKIGSK